MSADPIIAAGDFYPGDIDEMLAAIRQVIVDADDDLPEFTARNVVVIDPEETAQSIDAKIKKAVAMAKGVCLLVVSDGAAENVDTDSDVPRPRIDLELQLYLARNRVRRASDARSPQAMCAALAKFLHRKELSVSDAAQGDEFIFRRWTPIPDDTYHAWAIGFDREMSL